jgi:putative inorganic carbon (HCO3(-)) transporter
MATFFLLLYTVLLFIRPHEWIFFNLGETQYIRYTLLACTALFVIHKGKNLDLPQTRFMLLFTLTILLSLIFSGWLGSILVYGETFIQQSLLPFILLTAFLDTRKKLNVILFVVIITSGIMVLNGYYQSIDFNGLGLIGNPAYRNQDFLRITYVGFFNDPNDLGMFLAMSIPVVFYFKNKSPTLLKPLFWGLLVAILYGIYLTNSRGTLLATIALCAYWFWTTHGPKKSIYVGILLLPALLFVLSRFRTITTEEESAEGRLEAWYEGYQMLMSNPIFGVGYNQFLEYHFRTAHNSFVLAFSELGLLGVFAWSAVLTSTMLVLLKIANKTYVPVGLRPDDPRFVTVNEEAVIAKMFIFMFIAYFASAFFLSRTYTPFFYFFLGLSASSVGRIRKIFPDLSRMFDYREIFRVSFIVAIGGVIGIYVIVRLFL